MRTQRDKIVSFTVLQVLAKLLLCCIMHLRRFFQRILPTTRSILLDRLYLPERLVSCQVLMRTNPCCIKFLIRTWYVTCLRCLMTIPLICCMIILRHKRQSLFGLRLSSVVLLWMTVSLSWTSFQT